MPLPVDTHVTSTGSEPTARTGWRVVVANLATLAAVGVGLGFFAGFAARLHWICELLTHFRAHDSASLVFIGVVLLACGARRRGMLALITGLGIGSTLLPLYWAVPIKSESNWRLVSVNVHADNQNYAELVNFIQETRPDVVVGLEINERWAEVLFSLSDDYPYQKLQPQTGNFGIGMLSRFPLRDSRIEWLSDHNPAIFARIQLPDGREITVVGSHPVPPMSAKLANMRNSQLAHLAGHVKRVNGPIIVAGDLNTTSWSPAFIDFIHETGLKDSRAGFGNQPTWRSPLSPVGIAIDHALVSEDVGVVNRQVGRDIGSDHRPIVIDFAR
ncbi:MAG: endonuclease/exonuclease/phosphatase family protein [Planctomycetota bacterium]|nr:endonuclease/exonuclease/phosphatase family protein [Planctomycetota bacterium]